MSDEWNLSGIKQGIKKQAKKVSKKSKQITSEHGGLWGTVQAGAKVSKGAGVGLESMYGGFEPDDKRVLETEYSSMDLLSMVPTKKGKK